VTLVSEFQAGLDDLYAAAGVPFTFTNTAGATSTVVAIIDYDLTNYGDVAEVSQATASISVRKSDMEFPPRRGETFTTGSKTLRVSSTLNSDDLEHTVLVA